MVATPRDSAEDFELQWEDSSAAAKMLGRGRRTPRVLRSWTWYWNAVQHPFRADVLVDIGPVYAVSIANQLPMRPLFWCRIR